MNLRLEYDSFQDFANRLWPCLSEEGMWVRSDNPAAVGEIVDFDVLLADGFRLFHGTGQVIAVGRGPRDGENGEGMTVRFSQLDQPSRNLVRKVVSKHIGEGGRIFVLSTPATKVEVVGGDESAEPSDGAGKGLVAPFADFESDASWNQESEPELKSFLRPSGRDPEPAKRPSPSAGEFDFDPIAGVEDGPAAAAEEPLAQAQPPEIEASEDDWTDGAVDGDDADDAPPSTEDQSIGDLFPDLGRESRSVLGETQRIEPEVLDREGEAQMSLEEGGEGSLGPLPSTVIPPSFRGLDAGTEVVDPADEPTTDEFLMEGMDSGGSRPRWLLVAVLGLIVGGGLFALLKMGNPISDWFWGSEPSVATTGQAPASESPRAATRPPLPLPTSESPIPEPGAVEGVASEDLADPQAPAAEDETAAPSAIANAADGAAPPDQAARKEARDQARAARQEAAAAPVPAPTPAPTAVSAPDSAPAPEPLRLRRITWRQEAGDTVVRLALDGAAAADRFETLEVPGENPRLVLKILGVAGSVPRDPVPIGSAEVRQLRFGVHAVEGVRQVHVVADLTAASVQLVGTVAIDDGGVELRFRQP